jgi:hypothetical protein
VLAEDFERAGWVITQTNWAFPASRSKATSGGSSESSTCDRAAAIFCAYDNGVVAPR